MNQNTILNNGVVIPALGFGVYQIPPGPTTEQAVLTALHSGYRMIDTAAYYQNETDVGVAIKKSGLPRADIFVTTKLHPLRFWRVETAFHASLKRLGLEYVDLYLIHWPFGPTKQLWKILEKIYGQGYVRAIGVSNFSIHHLESLLKTAEVVPTVNQVEFHPFLYRKKLLAYCASKKLLLKPTALSLMVNGLMT